jgi:deoxyribonuclease V
MRVAGLHPWAIGAADARNLQTVLAAKVSRVDDLPEVRTVCGLDVGIRGGMARAACAVMSFPSLDLIEENRVESAVSFPYVPGLLSFREIPALIPLLEGMGTEPDLVLADGQGISHPRRFGLASHLGLLLDRPSIGCAKSRLVGSHDEPGPEKGDLAYLRDRGEVVGAALRVRPSVKPLYVSIGHRISLETAVSIVLRCCRSYRIPEPLRRAHKLASGV